MLQKNNLSELNIPINLFFVICTSKWLFEGILARSYLEIIGFAMALALQIIFCYSGRIVINKRFLVFGVYLISIFGNVVCVNPSVSSMAKAILQMLILLFATLWDVDRVNINKVLRTIVNIGLFYSFMILVHYILKDNFNAVYFKFLNPTDLSYAQAYYRGGRYFGLHISPHEVAGIVTFAIFVLLIRNLENKNNKIINLLTLSLCIVALLLTGKRGVLFCGVISFVLLLLVLYGNRKQWIRAAILIVVASGIFTGAKYYILMHANNPILNRYARLINSLSDGTIYKISRFKLYEQAISLWHDKPLFGIGWRLFKGQSIGISDAFAHEVNLDYLQWLCELGIIGFLLNMLFVVYMLANTLHVCKYELRNIEQYDKKCITMFAIASQFFVILYAFCEIPFYDVYFFSMYAISCSIIIRVRSSKSLSRGFQAV